MRKNRDREREGARKKIETIRIRLLFLDMYKSFIHSFVSHRLVYRIIIDACYILVCLTTTLISIDFSRFVSLWLSTVSLFQRSWLIARTRQLIAEDLKARCCSSRGRHSQTDGRRSTRRRHSRKISMITCTFFFSLSALLLSLSLVMASN